MKSNIILCIILILTSFCWAGGRIVKNIVYTQNCGGYLKRAADANTIEMANTELSRAIEYLEKNNLTTGYTSVLYKTPNEDVGFWYNNLKASQEELLKIKPNTSMLEKTNVLMKLRETLLDNGEKGTTITQPGGISVYPNNTAWAVFGWISFILLLFGCVVILSELEDL